MTTPAKASTANHILDVAEKHFSTHGFAGTSLRAIIKEAGVNVAAVAYHFGNKEQLYSAVMERFAIPVVEKQLEQLREYLIAPDVELSDVIRAFYEPPIRLVKSLGERGETLSMFLGRAQTETEPIFSLIDQHYASCRNEFIAAFKQLLPGLSQADYHWNFEFMLSLIVCFLTRQAAIRQRYSDSGEWDADEVISRLISFCEPGLKGAKKRPG